MHHHHHHHHHHRRRKKRPNYGARTVEVSRGYNGFGFTISGQQPCILSCIVANSPADQAGLRAGDFLISVNGLNVSKLPHEAVVQLIGNSLGTIRMQIAENYFSDSSDEENVVNLINRVKPRYLHHKLKMNRLRNSPQKVNESQNLINDQNCHQNVAAIALHPVIEDVPLPTAHNIIHSPNASTSKDISNVSAMVRKSNESNGIDVAISSNANGSTSASLEYRAIVGYLGTIEMPKQIATSSKLQTVRSCIRKMRQEKRNPITILMTILPNCLILRNSNATILATYPSSRLNYVSSSSESENRFFGLVTSAMFTSADDEPGPMDNIGGRGIVQDSSREVIISNSCHVFVVDTKICDHLVHEQKAAEFKITCTKDPISNLCLEFPNNSEYVVNLIRSMYTMKVLPPSMRQANSLNPRQNGVYNDGQNGNGSHDLLQANSPQPSNHSEVTTTSSNSDSGIGFHNDCTNISDRILVVDFPALMMNRISGNMLARPHAICNDIESSTSNLPEKSPVISINPPKLKSEDLNTRLTVRAMPDPKNTSLPQKPNIPDLLASFNNSHVCSSLSTTRSCDDVITSVERNDYIPKEKKQLQMSMDDIAMLSSSGNSNEHYEKDNHIFIQPSKPALRKPRRNSTHTQNDAANNSETESSKNLTSYKLSPKVFGMPRFSAISVENLFHKSRKSNSNGGKMMNNDDNDGYDNDDNDRHQQNSFDIWGSLQDLHKNGAFERCTNSFLEGTYSEPDLVSRALPSASSSPFRRWGQSSFRTSKTTTDPRQSLSRRPSSLAASETDVYSKSMDEDIDNINNCYHSSHNNSYNNNNADQLLSGQLIKNSNNNQNKFYNNYHQNNDGHNQHQINNKHHQQHLQQHHNHQNHQYHNSLNQDSNEFNNNGSSNVADWGTSFEKLLEDPSGLHTFAEFLKKEFSAENIYFWTACERYRQIDSHTERSIQAMQIFSKHLATKASEPVNVDSQARNITEENLKAAEKNLFSQAQKQIFNLMKFDSYQRFIRSDLYKRCLEAESKNQPLPYPGDQLDELLRTTINPTASSRLKKSASNAEDRRRKSLLPWHRKTRCKSRDRNECDLQSSKSSAKSQSSGNSLKLPTANSASDIHSSRSSLSSFDATVAASIGSGSDDSKACSLCRVILCDGATTIVQTRPDETIKQLIDRLLEKRGIHYQFFDVILSGQTKSIDLENPATILAGKEVQIEQRVAFKLDLPDPKVISVKSKPKKILCEVLKPILHKYNYRLDDVQVLIKDTHEELDMSLPVTEIDGQRLQVVLLKSEDWKQDLLQQQQKQPRLTYGLSALSYKNQQQQQQQLLTKNAPISSKSVKVTTQQTTLDEITNKVFNELLQGKVESHGNQCSMPKASDRSSLKSDDCASESSSIFERLRHRDSSIPGLKGLRPKKLGIMPSKSSVGSEDGFSTSTQITNGSDPTNNCIKKPLIAKWKAGVKLQVPGRTENHEEFLEGLKRAQRARLEDQRGTEINSELPDFLKDKENFNAACKLQKTRANLSPVGGLNTPRIPVIGGNSNDSILPSILPTNNFEINSNILTERPQPAPRLSITKMNQNNNNASSPSKSDQNSPNEIENSATSTSIMNNSNSSSGSSSNRNDMILNNSNGSESMNSGNEFENDISKGPPPLPPKPKVLPMKPSNWGQAPATGNGNNPTTTTTTITNTSPPSRIPVDTSRRHLTLDQNSNRNVYLDQPSSSFV